VKNIRDKGGPVVIELAGLPGAGKSSLAKAVSIPHAGRADLSWLEARLAGPMWPVAMATLRLLFSIRPLKLRHVVRAAKLIATLRFYGPSRHRFVILDQGIVQKLWSLVIETGTYSDEYLEEVVTALVPFTADHLIWISVQPDVAAQRIVNRKGGKSRFDGGQLSNVVARLEGLRSTYDKIISQFEKHAHLPVLRLNGQQPLSENAEKITHLIETAYGMGSGGYS
jgi:hypothetical protein